MFNRIKYGFVILVLLLTPVNLLLAEDALPSTHVGVGTSDSEKAFAPTSTKTQLPAKQKPIEEVFTPISPPHTNSPRQTFQEFYEKINIAADIIYNLDASSKQNFSVFRTKSEKQTAHAAEERIEQAIRTFNLKEIPEAQRKRVGLERALMLKDILDRIPLPNPKSIPDIGEQTLPKRWEIPNTEIAIELAQESHYKNEYLFSTDTISRIPYFYKEMIDSTIVRNDTSHHYNFYHFYSSTPGSLLPPKWSYLIPSWSKNQLILEQTLWQWIALGITLILTLSICFVLIKKNIGVVKNFSHSGKGVLLSLLTLLVLWSSNYFITNVLNITSTIYQASSFGHFALIYITLSWTAYSTINWLTERFLKIRVQQDSEIDVSVIRTLARLVSIISATSVLYFGATQLGIPIAPLIAGFGGLALAIGIGAQEYFKNIVGGLTLFLDRPIRVGESCEFKGIKGKIEDIGLRSIKIRIKDENSLVMIPNAIFSTSNITNYSRRNTRVIKTTLELDRSLQPTIIKSIINDVKQYLTDSNLVLNSIVKLVDIDNGSSDILVRVEVNTNDSTKFMDYREEFFFKLMEITDSYKPITE